MAKKEAPVEETVINTEEAPKKKPSKAEAEAIVKKYTGINGIKIPELEEAKKVLKG